MKTVKKMPFSALVMIFSPETKPSVSTELTYSSLVGSYLRWTSPPAMDCLKLPRMVTVTFWPAWTGLGVADRYMLASALVGMVVGVGLGVVVGVGLGLLVGVGLVVPPPKPTTQEPAASMS